MSFISNLNWRYATDKFDPKKPVSQEVLDAVLESIRMAPTSYGVQPFHVTIVTNQDIKEKFKAAAWGQEQVSTAPYVLVFSARLDLAERIQEYLNNMSGGNAEAREKLKGFEEMMNSSLLKMSPEESKHWSTRQAYIALGFGLAACAELSVDSGPMEGFDKAEYKKILNLPENLDPVVLLTVGYRAEDSVPGQKTRFSKDEMFDMIK